MFDIFTDNNEETIYNWSLELYAVRFILESQKFRNKSRTCKRFVKELDDKFINYKHKEKYYFGLVII